MNKPNSKIHYYVPHSRHSKHSVGISPPVLLACSFALMILLGTLALKLPLATNLPIGWHQALFTAVSAVTVTGLTVVDTASEFSFFGQVVIIILIQLGGIGIMTFAVVTAVSLGWRISLKQQLLAREALSQTSLSQLVQTAKVVLIMTLSIEAIGVLILTCYWTPTHGFSHALWHGIFYSISAYNNAGFALDSNSLNHYVNDPVINITITALFITGGLGFIVLAELWQKRWKHRLSIYTRMMLWSTLAINLIAMISIALLEWKNPGTLGALQSTAAKLWAAWFQAVTPRTAGFNTVDTSQLTEASSLLTIFLMFVGGGANSTAGGVKLSTFIVLALAIFAFLRHRPTPHIGGRTIGQDTVYKSMVITFISMTTLFIAVFILSITEVAPLIDILFESVSAMSTVGMSRGLTGQLTYTGQAIIMILMFIGRIGPLTMAYLLTTPKQQLTRYPVTEFQVG